MVKPELLLVLLRISSLRLQCGASAKETDQHLRGTYVRIEIFLSLPKIWTRPVRREQNATNPISRLRGCGKSALLVPPVQATNEMQVGSEGLQRNATVSWRPGYMTAGITNNASLNLENKRN